MTRHHLLINAQKIYHQRPVDEIIEEAIEQIQTATDVSEAWRQLRLDTVFLRHLESLLRDSDDLELLNNSSILLEFLLKIPSRFISDFLFFQLYVRVFLNAIIDHRRNILFHCTNFVLSGSATTSATMSFSMDRD